MIARLFVEHAVHFAHPAIDDRVGRHSPVATWREADAAHLWSVGQAAALELLREEAPEERVQPVVDKLAGVLALEGVHGQHEDLLGAEAEAEEIVEEEVVEFIGTHQVFRLLCDVALVVCRRQFGRDRCVDDIVEHLVGRASILGKLLGGLVGVGHEGHEEGERKRAQQALDQAKGHLRSLVGHKAGLRLTPQLQFVFDEVPGEAHEIEDILAVAKKRDEELAKSRANAQYAGDADPYKHDDEPSDDFEDDSDEE